MAIGFAWLTPLVRKLLAGLFGAVGVAVAWWLWRRSRRAERERRRAAAALAPRSDVTLAGVSTSSTSGKAGAQASEYDAAVAFVSAGEGLRLTTEQQLRFYALFKQASAGDNDRPRPSMLDMTGCAKWDAWTAVSGMSADEARAGYVAALASIAPNWKTHSGVLSDAAPSRADVGGLGGPHVVRPAAEIESDEDVAADPDKYLDAAMFSRVIVDGNIGAVRKLLATGKVDINGFDEAGCTPLHFACDRGVTEIAALLLQAGANVRAVDSDGSTALHFAAVSDEGGSLIPLAQLLLDNGASVTVADNDGCTAAQVAESREMRDFLQAAAARADAAAQPGQ